MANAPHGGFDGGAVAYDGTVEKEINLNIALRLQKMLQFCGAEVIMTRTEDTATDTRSDETVARRKKSDLQNRLGLMEQYADAVYVSIHLNKFTTGAASGAQVFYTPNFPEAARLGQCIQDSFVASLQPENTRVIKEGTKSTYLLKNAKVPAVIVECGFLSNRQELERLKSDDYQAKLSFVILQGILKYREQE
ncbi:MAG: N-acetylmuramoyl-L-alanine amidase [Clostridia bacterium]|nr:N-acetylmuramoyl-L-alanine amidase [Clostridia bacterium]